MKLIKEIFEPICPEKFTEFLDMLKATQTDFDELADWEDLTNLNRNTAILQFSLVTGMKVNEVKAAVDMPCHRRREIQSQFNYL